MEINNKFNTDKEALRGVCQIYEQTIYRNYSQERRTLFENAIVLIIINFTILNFKFQMVIDHF